MNNSESVSRVVVIGIGGAGMNILEEVEHRANPAIQCIAFNTDKKRINKSPFNLKFLVKIKEQRDSVEIHTEENAKGLINVIQGADAVVLLAGLGGRTGSLITLEMAKMCSGLAKQVWVFCVTPFNFESHRIPVAVQATKELQDICDLLFTFSNQELIKQKSDWSLLDGLQFVENQFANMVELVPKGLSNPERMQLHLMEGAIFNHNSL